MKKIMIIMLLCIMSKAVNATTYLPQSVVVNNNTSCWVYVNIFGIGAGPSCTEYLVVPDWLGYYPSITAWYSCCSGSVGIPPGSSLSFDNCGTIYGELSGSWFFHNVGCAKPGTSKYCFTGITVVGSWSGTPSCGTPDFCGINCNYLSNVSAGEACTGWGTVGNAVGSPKCCGSTVTWTSTGFGTSATVDIN